MHQYGNIRVEIKANTSTQNRVLFLYLTIQQICCKIGA
nr:MAG TPA: hypothetical protein [Bacteriophage sp.]